MSDPKPNKPNEAAIAKWSKEEKYHLIRAIKSFGRHDIKNIQEYVSSKTVEETQEAIAYYTKIALQHPMFVKKQQEIKTKASKKPRVPLASWAKLLTDSLQYNELRTETASAVRMIADLEDFPSPVCTDNINFRQVYHQIANAMEGKPLSLDVATAAVLHKCLIETALSSKAFIKTAAYRYIINTIDLSDKEINMFPRPTEHQDLAILRHFAAQRSYNPLKIPEEYLKPSCDAAIRDCKIWPDVVENGKCAKPGAATSAVGSSGAGPGIAATPCASHAAGPAGVQHGGAAAPGAVHAAEDGPVTYGAAGPDLARSSAAAAATVATASGVGPARELHSCGRHRYCPVSDLPPCPVFEKLC